MKQYLLPENGNSYKANLHCHTKVSDGLNTPEEMRDFYKAHGYSVLAITDHELLVDHSDINQPDFLALTGYEYAFSEQFYNPYNANRTGFTAEGLRTYCHIHTLEFNLFPRDPHNVTHICFNPKWVIHGERWRCDTVKSVGNSERRDLALENVQEFIDTARANGFIVSLNHPHHSFYNADFFGQLKGLFAIELIHQGGYYGWDEFNPHTYDDMIRMGHRIGGLGTDDNHRTFIEGDENDIRPWAHTVIIADSLKHEDIFSALENKNFYATQGPRFNELYVEDGVVHFSFEKVKYACMHTNFRHSRYITARNGEFITSAEFELPLEEKEFFRFEIIDMYGRRAITRAYFPDEIK